MSNEKSGQNPLGRKPKGSDYCIHRIRESGKSVPNGKLKGASRWGKEVQLATVYNGTRIRRVNPYSMVPSIFEPFKVREDINRHRKEPIGMEPY